MIKAFRWLLLAISLHVATPSLFSSVEMMKCPMGRDYDLYLPEKIDPDRIYWLVCYVHGSNGSASDHVPSLKRFVERGDCIGVAPSFAHGFQLLENGTDQQLIGILHQLSTKYHLHEKLFIYGHSAGGQFSHRFTMLHPDIVIGCESCSSGTWATGGIYQSPNLAAQNIPIAIACGGDDVGKRGATIARVANDNSFPVYAAQENRFCDRVRRYHHGVPCSFGNPQRRYAMSQQACSNERALINSEDPGWNRIEWFNKFSELLQRENFFFKGTIFPGEQHNVDQREQTELAMESFLLGTCGMIAQERATYDAFIAAIKKNKAEGKTDLVTSELQQLQQSVLTRSKERLRAILFAQGWHPSEAALDQCLTAGQKFVNEEITLLQK